ncbi:MAG: hypothetical protein ABIJ50_11715, partial [Pseudomonadota bacterium]
GDEIPSGTFHGGDEIPSGTFHGGDEIPSGTFHGGDEIPSGTFHGEDEIPLGTFHGGDEIPSGTFHCGITGSMLLQHWEEEKNVIPTPSLPQELIRKDEEALSGNDQNCHQSPGQKTEKILHKS